ncbi:hypothetical protein INT46_000464 [Mucor plumbeus]|uniref:Uncharacterized protein n=1 Tax=Mucor plumbeus TaxID=97098 RepID=A0A8H7UYA9_9FUNG|nr:hypothetical protein INT46_000464 [Mucor plumbeus]
MLILSYFKAQQQQMPIQTVNISSIKRKFEDDSEQFVKAKRLNFLKNKKCQLIKEEIEEKNQLLLQLMPAITYASPDYKPSSNAISNFANQNMHSNSVLFGTITPPTEQQQFQQQQQEEVSNDMIMEDDYTDEDESLQTPSYMNHYSSYISTDVGEDVEDGGYTGQLERGWSEMFNEMN